MKVTNTDKNGKNVEQALVPMMNARAEGEAKAQGVTGLRWEW